MQRSRPQLLHDALVQSAETSPARFAVADEFARVSYEDLLDEALRMARLLHAEGLQPGDRVAISLDNTARCVSAIFGTLIAGGIFMVVGPQTKKDRLAFILADSEAAFLLCEGHSVNGAQEAAAAQPRVVHLFVSSNSSKAAVPSLDQALAASDPAPSPAATRPSDLATLVYTSGTTGQPKGVMLSHEALVFVSGSIAQYLRLSADDRILNILPLAFTYGLSQLLLSVRLGATLLLERSFAFPARTLERMHSEEATVFGAVPTVYATLIGMQHDHAYENVRCLTNAAAELPAAFHDGLRRLFPNANLFRMYGQTECVRISYLEPELIDRKPTSVGRAIPGTEVVVLNDEGASVAPGERGVLHVRGPHLMAGYWRDPELSKHSLKPGLRDGETMLCTHDEFTVDAEGFLYFAGRTDDIIKTRGEKVSPAEIENVLHGIAGVRQAAVVGVPDQLLGQAIRAYVVLEDGAALTEKDILRLAASKLENYMMPREIVLRAELPHTDSGKIRKRSLLEEAASVPAAET